jgi:hypothetical protein
VAGTNVRRAVRASEKKDELWRAGLARPRCECHNAPMQWAANVVRRGGGQWKCPVKRREYQQRRYAQAKAGGA